MKHLFGFCFIENLLIEKLKTSSDEKKLFFNIFQSKFMIASDKFLHDSGIDGTIYKISTILKRTIDYDR